MNYANQLNGGSSSGISAPPQTVVTTATINNNNTTATSSPALAAANMVLNDPPSSDSEPEFIDNSSVELRGYLSKWTNYIYGWQPRYIVLKDGTLSYYKSESESDFGCRGAISLSRATIKVSFVVTHQTYPFTLGVNGK